jgi:phosphoribosylaminoimidazolecarboxamide formyltransferase/IMP cyclohydrolase
MNTPSGAPATRRTAVRRALISVYDKYGVVDLARALHDAGIEILSTGGTARMLLEAGLPIRRISEVTGTPEMLDGRVKTLHPKVHAGILAVRDNPRHQKDLAAYGAEPIDLVVANLYPFEMTARMEGIGLGEIIEMIDIGGPTMVRAAAKNFRDVGVVVDPADYGAVVDEIREHGGLSDATRLALSRKAFQHTASYDSAVYTFMAQLEPDGTRRAADSPFPQKISLTVDKIQDLRYGENPHQKAAFYAEVQGNGATLAHAAQLHGSELSFNNLLDFDAAFAAVSSLDGPGCVVVKHNNPSGAAVGEDAAEAFRLARDADPVSAYGGVVAFNRTVDEDAALALGETFFEGVIAPGYTAEAREALKKKKKLRVLELGGARAGRPGLDVRRVSGGYLLQEWDSDDSLDEVKIATRRAPTEEEWAALRFAWRICRHVRSNAIVLAKDHRTVGIGAGQMSRVDSVRIAVVKAGEEARGSVMASDAFFPFPDGVEEAARAGVTAVIQPGGSIRDEEVVAAVDRLGLAMLFTGRRHFRH